MAVPMKNGGMKISKVIFYVVLSGITTGVGAFFGSIIGSISEQIIAICLSFAARSDVIHCIWRINTRSKSLISWKDDSPWKYDRIHYRYFCNKYLKNFPTGSPQWFPKFKWGKIHLTLNKHIRYC